MIDRKENYIPVDIDRIRKVNNDLKLKRCTPVTNPNNTLESCMAEALYKSFQVRISAPSQSIGKCYYSYTTTFSFIC